MDKWSNIGRAFVILMIFGAFVLTHPKFWEGLRSVIEAMK